MNDREKIDRLLNDEWNHAAAAGDAGRLAELRLAFENNELSIGDQPVLVRGLTDNQTAIACDVYPESDDILASGKTWILFRSVDRVRDVISERDNLIDECVDRALGNNLDMTEAQEAFTIRAATKSIASLCEKLYKAISPAINRPTTTDTARRLGRA